MMRGRFFDTPLFELTLQECGESELASFVRKNLTATLGRIQEMLRQLPPDQCNQLTGGRRSAIKTGLTKLAERDVVWQDLLHDETRRLHLAVGRFYEAVLESDHRIPKRLLAQRQHAGKALADEDFDSARELLVELLEQPIARRDAYTLILSGWLHHRRGELEQAKSAFSQACLYCEGPIFEEASRLLAAVQLAQGNAKGALQTIRRDHSNDPMLRFEQFRLAILNGEEADALADMAMLIPTWPVAILGLYCDQAVLAKVSAWRPALEQLATDMQLAARDSVMQWSRSLEEAKRTLMLVDSSLEMPEGRMQELDAAQRLSAMGDIFVAHWVIAESQRGMANVAGAARSVLRGSTRRLQETALRAERDLQSLQVWRDEQLLQVAPEPMDEPPPTFAFGLWMGGIAFASISSAALALYLPLAGALAPLLLGFLMASIAFQSHRMARTNYSRRSRELEAAQLARVNDIEATYQEDSEAVLKIAKEARKLLQQADASIELFNNWPSDFRAAA